MSSILQRYTHVALFLFFEIIALVLVVNFNQKQKDIFLHSTSIFSGSILKKSAQLGDYLSLQQSNNDLLAENARLLTEIINMPRDPIPLADSNRLSFEVIPTHVISNSLGSQRNRLLVDRGRKDGIISASGATTEEGVVGIVHNVNEHFSTIMSLLNVDIRISASVEGADFFGTITWDGNTYDRLDMTGIPTHAQVDIGDEVITNGYSTIFPKGLKIGSVESVQVSNDGAFYEISVKPMVDFAQLNHVYILQGNFAEEVSSLAENE